VVFRNSAGQPARYLVALAADHGRAGPATMRSLP
jgi:hypothetical protein